MNLRFVEAFHWAVSLRSVTRAAEKLHITQSALSSRIAALASLLATGMQGAYDSVTTWLPTFLKTGRQLSVLGQTLGWVAAGCYGLVIVAALALPETRGRELQPATA